MYGWTVVEIQFENNNQFNMCVCVYENIRIEKKLNECFSTSEFV